MSRQSRREWGDSAVLDALGTTRWGMVTAAAIRTSVIAVLAAAVAFVTALAVSPLGPIGIGRAAEPHPGFAVDWVVAVVGLPVVALAVMTFALVPIATLPRRSTSGSSTNPTSRTLSLLPPAGMAGLAMSNSRRGGRLALGSAVVGVAFAAAGGVAAWSLVTSYDELLADPARYGSTWDAQVGNVGDRSQEEETRRRLESIPGIEAVGIRSIDGIGEPGFVVYAGEPFLGDATLGPITDGRAPSTPREVALGSASMKKLGVGIGDSVEFTDPADPASTFSFDVVGEVVVNDHLVGASRHRWTRYQRGHRRPCRRRPSARTMSSGSTAPRIADATLAALEQAFPTTYLERSTPRQVTNLGLVSGQPILLALVIAVLAGAALIHALITSVRGSRRQIGVLKSIGFTNRQVLSTVAWHASSLSAAALVVGIPMGIVIGRVTWRAIVDSLGLVSAPALPVGAILAVAVLVLVVANLAALGPGWAAARTRAATALRTE